MRFAPLLAAAVAALTGVAEARSPQHVGRTIPGYLDPRERMADRQAMAMMQARATNSSDSLQHLTDATKKFYVDGTKIPEVDFDIGESYAGLLPISSNPNATRQLYFWYFPSKNPAAKDEITLWLNGGPGCSSLEGLLQENGPFQWQYGTLKPVPNPWTWVNLTNVVWVEQPVGTGFSPGTPEARTEADVANEFLGFWKNFVETFSLQGRKIYIAGESYAGMYVPHIASAMLDTNNTKYYNLEATMIYDPSINTDEITENIPAPAFVEYWAHLFSLNNTFLQHMRSVDQSCGLTAYMDKWLTYPPKGKFAPPPTCGGGLFNDIINAAQLVNPCWDIYQVATTCPLLYDVLGFPGSFTYLPPGGQIYFNRPDVKKAINAPVDTHWYECSPGNVYATADGLSVDANQGRFSSVTVLPGVIERSARTIIAHGALDMVLIANGTLLSIQNMTWNGKQGFSAPPTDEFYVPYHTEHQETTIAASGVLGRTRTERGLTYVEVDLCGHMEPQYQPSASFRHMEFLLGRVPSLSSLVPFTKSNDGLEAQQDAPE